MSRGVTIEVQGLEALKKKLGVIPENVTREVDAELAATANGFVNRAVEAAPVDTGTLRNQITFTRIGELNYEVVSGVNYSAYVEFGTIKFVNVPAELATYAAQFKGKGLKQNGGMHPHPFFFPQLPIAQEELNKNLKAVVNRALQ